MILSIGLTPAWQQMLRFSALELGEVNRTADACWLASGKVLNATMALHQLGAPVHTISLLGGTPAALIPHEFNALGLPADWIHTLAPTRVCTTLHETTGPRTTELVENAQPVSDSDRQQLLDRVRERAPAAQSAVIAGSLPPGTSEDFYKRLIATLREAGGPTLPVVLDARGPELLAALQLGVDVIKPNRSELARTVGRDLSRDEDLWDAMREMNRCGARWAIITEGSRAVWVSADEQILCATPPKVSVDNPIGCGDSMAGALGYALAQKMSLEDAVRLAVAVASAAAMTYLPARFELSTVETLREQVKITAIS